MSDSTERSAYFCRIITLVVDVGTVTLRNLFYSICPKAYVVTLFTSPQVLSEFSWLKSKGILTSIQHQHVTINPDPDTYDISLLIKLLINKKIGKVTVPATGRGNSPPDTDKSLGADLLRIRDIRNQIVGHRPNAQLEQKEFQALWDKTEKLLVKIASHVDSTEEANIKQMIKDAKTRVLEPLNAREKKLLQVFLEWQKEDAEKYQSQLNEVLKSLDDLHLKVDATDASRSDDKLTLLQSQVESIAKNIGNMAQQGAVQEIHENVQSMHGDINGLHQTIQMLEKQLEDYNRRMEMQTQQIQGVGQQPAILIYERDGHCTRQPVANKPKTQNPYAMSEKEILDLSKKIGNEWEQLRIHLDFTKAQADALKGAYNDDVQQRIHQMLKTWHDVVVDCGENPKMLLAAAFVNASTNYAMAYKLVPKEQFNANAEAKQTTVEQIQEIVFSKRGYDRPGSGPYLLHSGPVSVNVYGDVRFEGSVAIPSSQSNQSCSMYYYMAPHIKHRSMTRTPTMGLMDNGDDSTVSRPPSGSFNVYGGKVTMGTGSNFVIGLLRQRCPAQNFNPPVT